MSDFEKEIGTRAVRKCPNCRTEGSFAGLPSQSRRLPNDRLLLVAVVLMYLPLVVFGPLGRSTNWWVRVISGGGFLAAGLLMSRLPGLTRSWFERVRFCRACGLALVVSRPGPLEPKGPSKAQLLLWGRTYPMKSRSGRPKRDDSEVFSALTGRASRSGLVEQLRTAVRHIFRMR